MWNWNWPEKTNHHIIPKNRANEWFNVHHELNQIVLSGITHQKHHSVYGDLTPQEQLQYRLDLNWRVLSEDIKFCLQEILSMDIEEFYAPELVNKRVINK